MDSGWVLGRPGESWVIPVHCRGAAWTRAWVNHGAIQNDSGLILGQFWVDSKEVLGGSCELPPLEAAHHHPPRDPVGEPSGDLLGDTPGYPLGIPWGISWGILQRIPKKNAGGIP